MNILQKVVGMRFYEDRTFSLDISIRKFGKKTNFLGTFPASILYVDREGTVFLFLFNSLIYKSKVPANNVNFMLY